MSGHPWYKRYGSDFIAGTLGMTLEEKGAYSILLDLIYDRGGPVPDDARFIAGVCGCSLRKWSAIRNRLIGLGKIIDLGGLLDNGRARIEIEKAAKTAEERAESGSKGGKKRAENDTSKRENNALGEAELKHTGAFQIPDTREDSSSLRSELSSPPASETRSAGADPRSKPSKSEVAFRGDWPSDYRDQFWRRYPHKVGKNKGIPALDKVRKSGAVTFARLLDGLDRYVRTKPPDRNWCNPATWLNEGRWDDEPDNQQPSRRSGGLRSGAHDHLQTAYDRVYGGDDGPQGGNLVDQWGTDQGGPFLDLEPSAPPPQSTHVWR